MTISKSGKKNLLLLAGMISVLLIMPWQVSAQNSIPETSYCFNDPPVDFVITNPGQKTWTCNVAGVIVNHGNGRATFSPSMVPGPYPRVIRILYQNPNYTGEPAAAYSPADAFYSFAVTITTPPVVTFSAMSEVCINSPAFPLAPAANPVGGTYAGPGVDIAGYFHPDVAGAGTHSLSYTYPNTGCNTTAYQMITVRALPSVSLGAFPDFCIDAPSFQLTTGSPAGGTYSGPGVTGDQFNPGAAGVGIHTITYTYSDGFCTNFATRTITVYPLPSVTIGGLKNQQCDTEPPYLITGVPTDSKGRFSGHGITDNLNGTAVFDPGSTGLGHHDIVYTYNDANGCSNTFTQNVRVGTELYIYGLDSKYCEKGAIVSFTYAPENSTNPLNRISGAGVTDNLDGTASFNPGAAGVGTHTVKYTFWDDIGCENIVTQDVTVAMDPDADFSGLSASLKYCAGSPNVNLTGNYPGGTFTGNGGSIIDNGNGTAVFRPSTLSPGVYSITYSYTNASGCTDVETKNIEILPLPAVYNVTGGGAYCDGTGGVNISLSNSETGVDYRLYRDGIAVVPDNTQHGLTGNAVSFGNVIIAGVYTVVATNVATGCTQQMSGSASVTVIPKSAITTQPVNATACEEGTATFTVQATGESLSYQWNQNGVNVGTNNNVLVLNNIALTDNNSQILCEITSTCGGVLTTNTVRLNVTPKTLITSHPSSANACTGSSITLSVAATGVNNVYRWEKGGVAVSNIAGKISGAGSANLTIFNLTTADAGVFVAYVDGDCGIVQQSNPAVLKVDEPIIITSQPVSAVACEGSNTSFTIAATGTSLAYQWWFNDGVNPAVAAGTGSNLAVNNVMPANAGTYYCVITSPCGATLTSNPVTLTVPANTVIVSNPVGGSICQGSNFNFTVVATGDNLQYLWFRNGVRLLDNAVVRNSTSPTLTLLAPPTTYSGNYTVRITGTCGVFFTAPAAVLSITQPLTFNTQPANQTVCSGSDANFSVVVTGDVLGYQWQFEGADIAGATSSNYTVTGATAVNAGNYRCLITTPDCGSYYSAEATLSINPVTAIVTQPVPLKTACVGNTVSFSVAATGTNLAYQWYKDGVSMGAGYTGAILSLPNITTASAGSYTCYVSGTCGTVVVSQPGVLVVDTPMVISGQPQSHEVCVGQPHELTVTIASGSNPVYQWYFNGNPVGGNSPVYSIPSFNAASAGSYYCTITNSCGTIQSNTAVLSLVNPFTITQQPADVSTCVNGTAVFTVAASEPGLTYQWMKDGAVIAGATDPSLIINNIQLADDGSLFSCVVTNVCGSTNSNTATLSVSTPVTITMQPQSGTACPGQPYNIFVTATGSNPVYQWYRSSTGIIAGANNPNYSIASFAAGDADTYYCVVSNSCGTRTSNNATVTLGQAIAITDPSPLSLCTGNDATFTVTATGDNPVYEWRKNDVPLADDGRIIGVSTNSLTINDITAADEGTYNVIVSGTCGLPKTSLGAFLDVTTPPSISQGPVPQTICSGQNASFSVTVPVVPGDPDPTYLWQKDGVTIVPAETASTINITGATTGGIYRCIITNACGSITSTSAELIIEQNVAIITQPVSQTLCEGSSATFTAGITGPTNMTLQWYKDGILLTEDTRITGVSLPSLTINNITAADAGSYWCEVTGYCGNTTTAAATLAVHDRIFITQQPQGSTICPNGTLNLSVVADGTVTGYQWKRNGVNVGTNSPTFTLTPFTPGIDDGNYTCELTNTCETVVSDVAVITAGIPTNANITGDQSVCEGHNAAFSITATGTDLTYQWYKGSFLLTDDARISGSQSANLTISSLVPSDAGTYQCDVTGTCGFDNDNSAVLTVEENISIDVDPASVSVLQGNTAVFTVVSSGNVTGYQWYKGATLLTDLAGEISGATTSTLSIINAQPDDAGNYSCTLTGPCGNVVSRTATLTVLTSTVITTQPITPVTLCEGSSLSLFITTSGSGHSYQWKQDDVNLSNGGNISGATTSALTINNCTTANTGAYTCVVDGVEISSASVVTINPATVITVNPAGGSKCEGDSHIFSVIVQGSALGYQWYKDNLSTPVGGNSNEYIINALTVADAGTYFCVVTSACGTKQSSGATLTVNANPVINAQPAGSTVCQGTTVTLFFDVTGSGLSYLWKKNGLPISDANITGITTNKLQISGSIPSNTADYTCTVTGACGGALVSNVATVTVRPLTAIITQPIGRTKCEGDGVVFTVDASGSNLTYDWRLNGTSLGLPSNPVLTINNLVKATHEGTYTCLVTGDCGTIITDQAVLTVNRNTTIGAPVISVSPICENGSTTITINATGDGLTYQWKKNGLPITAANFSGVTTSTLVISNALVTDAGVYTCTVTGACGSPLTSSNAMLAVRPATGITSQPSNAVRCSGDEVLFTATATGDNLTYQWLKGGLSGTPVTDGVQPSGSTITGASTGQMTITGVAAGDAGSYVCLITGTCGAVSSIPSDLTVNVPVTITAEPPALTQICEGASTTITVSTGGTTLAFRWKKDGIYLADGGSISGTGSNKLIISNALISDAGYYSCEISGTCNTLNTQSAELRVNTTTRITQQPAGRTLCEGDNVQFTVMATGTNPLSYQWRFNNVDIIGATTNTLTINNITPANVGAYTCVVSGASTCGTLISNPANLSINPTIIITDQPSDMTVCEDNTAIFALNATGTNLTYRWMYNNNYLTDDGSITGSNTRELIVSLATNADEGIYKCEILSDCGTRVSNSVVLTVTDSTRIIAQPLSQTLMQGATATFNVAATGEGISYQWQRNNVDIGGATASSYTIANVQPADAGNYRCIVTGSCGQILSDVAVLTVNQPVTITSQPAPQIVCEGQTASFSIATSGTVLKYQWKFNGADITDGGGISGATTPNLIIAPAALSHQGYYSCLVTGGSNTANSTAVLLTVNSSVTITQQPLTQTKCDGDMLVLEVTPAVATSTYSWTFNNNPLSDAGRVSGSGTSRLVITDVSSADAGSYRCIVSNTCGTIMSNPAVVTINPVVTVTADPVSVSRCSGQTAIFSVAASNPTVTYQWFKNGTPLSDNGRITGSTTSNLTINSLVTTDNGNYSCMVSDNCTSDNSAYAVLSVQQVAAIIAHPSGETICEGEDAFFEVSATGNNLIYQWQKDGINLTDVGNISGSSTSILMVQNATTGDQGVYRCLVSNSCNTLLSNPAVLSVNALPAPAGTITGSSVICQGSSNVLYVVPEIANAVSYVWTLPYGATIVSGLGNRSIQVDFSGSAVTGTISVHGINGCGSGAESPAFIVSVNPMPVAVAGADQTICNNATAFNANATAFGTWTIISGQASIADPNLPNSAVTGLGQGDNVFEWRVSQNGCTAVDTMVISNRQVNVNAGPDQTICSLSSQLSANTPTLGTGSWTVVSGAGTISSFTNPAAQVTNLARGTNIFRWSINNAGCISSDEVIIINDMPSNAYAGVDTVILVDNYTLDGNIPAVGTGFWSLISGSGVITSPTQYNTTVTNLGIGDNIFQWTLTNNMCVSQDEVKITNYTPTLTDAGPPQTLCDNKTTLHGTVPNYGTGQWSVISGSGTFVNPNKFDTEVTNIGRGPNIFRWTVYEYKVTYDDVTITNNSPSDANAGIDQSLCSASTSLAGNNPLIGTGIWTVTGGSGTITDPTQYNSPITSLGAGSNTLKWTITNSGCTSSDEVVIINDQPTQADAGVDQVTCADSVMLYPNTPNIGVGEWSIALGSATFAGNKATNLARGDNHLAWTIYNKGCFNSDTVVITSNRPTTAYAGEDKPVCTDWVDLSGNAPVYGTGVWTKLSGSGVFADVSDPKTRVTSLSYGQNRFRWTVTYNGCTSVSEVSIYYNFIQADAGADQTICQDSAVLDAADPGTGTGQWSVVGGSGSAYFADQTLTNTLVTNLDRGVNTLRWTVTNAGCVSYDDVLITNNTPTQAYAGSDRSVCGEEIYLSANNPSIGTGEWSVLSGSATITDPSLFNSTASNLSVGLNVLRWTITNQNCFSTDEVAISNDQPTNIEAGPNQYLCANTAQLFATLPSGGSGRWSIAKGSAVFADNTLFNTTVSNLEKGENRLVWTVTIGGCSNSDTVVIVNNLPSTPGAGPDQDLCADNAYMAANQPLIGTGKWGIVSGSATFEDITSPVTRVTGLGNGPNILRWSITNGSCVLYDEVTIQNSLPTVAYAGEDRSVCNTTANLLATEPVSGTGSWSVVSGYGVFSDATSYSSQITELGFGPNTLRWTTENGRCRTSDDVIITNNLAEAYAGADLTVYSSSVTLVGNVPASGIGQWVVLAGQGSIVSPANNETVVTGLGGGANTFSWTIDNNGCIASDEVVITYNKLPEVSFIPRPARGCAPLTVSFVNNSIGGSPFLWDFGDGTTSTATNTDHIFTLPGSYLVKLRATGPDGIALYKDTIIVVEKIPVAQFEIAQDTIYIPGQSAHFFNRTENIDSLLWEFGDGATSNEEHPSHTYTNTGTYDITLNVWTPSGCFNSLVMPDALFVDLAGIIKCPNAFTPSPDGSNGGYYNKDDFSNDVFHCFVEGVTEYHLEIYNRLGIVLFKSNDIYVGWDGYFNGKLVEEGAYIYKIYGKFNNGERFDYIGNIVLLH